jgi:hypothetical protein
MAMSDLEDLLDETLARRLKAEEASTTAIRNRAWRYGRPRTR